MNLLYPIGLLGLIGIPILILIYILKSKYKEYTISSTYIWNLSEKFIKKKSPISRLSGLLSLILQILTVLFLSFALAHPIISIPDSAKNYVLIVDNSASMQIDSRMEKVKDEMLTLVENAKNDSQFTIVLADEEAITLCNKETKKEKVIQIINSLTPSFISSTISNGLGIAQGYFDEDNTINTILYTDIRYASTNNIEVNNVENEEYNASINSLYYTKNDEIITFVGEVVSYNIEKELALDLYLDEVLTKSITISVISNEDSSFSIETPNVEFNEAKVVLNIEDDLSLDNQYKLFANESIDKYNVLLVSNKPFYLQTILSVLGDTTIDVTSSYNGKEGYDLYVFDGYSPTTLPTDGSIWLFNNKTNIKNAGFTVQGPITLPNGGTLTQSRNNNDVYNTLTNGITGNKISVSRYIQYSVYSSYTTIMSYNSHPMIFAGVNENGNRQVMFSFDLHDSNLPLLLDYIILFNNMIQYSIPSICDQNHFVCGEELVLNVLPQCESIRINSPSGKPSFLSLETDTVTYKLDEIGTYEILAKINGQEKIFKIFVAFPKEEQNPIKEMETIEIIGNKNTISHNSTYDIQWLLFIIVIVLAILEWEVYIYEQRNVR